MISLIVVSVIYAQSSYRELLVDEIEIFDRKIITACPATNKEHANKKEISISWILIIIR